MTDLIKTIQRPLKLNLYNAINDQKNIFVSISKPGMITISKRAVDELELQHATYCLWAYEASLHAICLRFINRPDPRASRITNVVGGGIRVVRMKFFTHHQLDIKKLKGRYIPSKTFIDNKLWIVILLRDKLIDDMMLNNSV